MNRLSCVTVLFAAAVATASAQIPVEKTLLWEISGKNFPAPCYLFGTIHEICERDLIISDTLRSKFTATEQLALELKIDDPQLETKMLKVTALPEGKILKDYLTSRDYEMVVHYMNDTLGFDFEKYETRKPEVLLSVMGVRPRRCKVTSWESKLASMAKKSEKPVLGLETVEEQFALMDRKPIDVQLKELIGQIRDAQMTRKKLEDLYVLYQNQDIAGISRMMTDSMHSKEYREFERVIVYERNKNWIPVIERLGKSKPTFFAVGGAHLGGEHGLIALLRQRGLTVKPVWQ